MASPKQMKQYRFSFKPYKTQAKRLRWIRYGKDMYEAMANGKAAAKASYKNAHSFSITAMNPKKKKARKNPSQWVQQAEVKNGVVPAGLFTKNADAIVKGLLKASQNDVTKAVRRITFYINRAGYRLSNARSVRAAQDKLMDMYRVKSNPASYAAMSYKEAHKWEPTAKKHGVSAVARSSRGFMRAYQRAGSFARLSPAWKSKRQAFIARHMAQAKRNNESLWSGNRPSRRALALIMWAYKPPKKA